MDQSRLDITNGHTGTRTKSTFGLQETALNRSNNLRRLVIQAVTKIDNLYFDYFFRTWDLVYDLTDQALAVLRPEKSQRA